MVLETPKQQHPTLTTYAVARSGLTRGQAQTTSPLGLKRQGAQQHQPQVRQSEQQQQAVNGLSALEMRLLPAKPMTFLITEALLRPHPARIPAHQVQAGGKIAHHDPRLLSATAPTRHHIHTPPTRFGKRAARSAPPLPRRLHQLAHPLRRLFPLRHQALEAPSRAGQHRPRSAKSTTWA